MGEESSSICLTELSSNNSARSPSFIESGASLQKFVDAVGVCQILKSRLTFLEGMLQKDEERSSGKLQIMDVTCVNNNCKVNLDDFWLEVEKKGLCSATIDVVLLNNLAAELLTKYESDSHQLSISAIEDLPRSFSLDATKFAGVSKNLHSLSQFQEEEIKDYVCKQDKVVKSAAKISQRVEHEKNYTAHQEHLKKINQWVNKTKCARAFMNCFLSSGGNVPVNQQEQLLKLKMKWRYPPNISEQQSKHKKNNLPTF